MEMCFHSNRHPSPIKHAFINLYSKYQSFTFICLPNMNSPIFPSLDDIYCTFEGMKQHRGRRPRSTQIERQ